MIGDFLKFSLKGLSHRKLRSWLTIIGIFIGISAVVGLISLGQGMQAAITEQFEELGTDKITISPGSGLFGPQAAFRSATLTESDLDVVRRVRGVDKAGGMLLSTHVIKFNEESVSTFVAGIPLDEPSEFLEESQAFEVKEGRDLRDGDKYKVVIGHSIAKGNVFDEKVDIRDEITIKGKEFRVVGTLKEIGNQMDDSSVMIPMEVARELFDNKDEYDMIVAKIKTGEEIDKVSEEIKEELRKEHDLEEGEEDFTVQTSQDLMESFSSILGIVTAVLIGIAAISLLVGGVGIMNTMYTSVLERTREIGIMKAVGAKNNHILLIFLFESGLIGIVGGIIGSALGIGMALIVTQYAANMGFGFLEAEISLELIFFAIGFSFLIGAISGVLPARRASKLQPVEALREL